MLTKPVVHYLPDWLPLAFKKVGKKGTELQRKMHFWGWEQTEKHHVRFSDGVYLRFTDNWL